MTEVHDLPWPWDIGYFSGFDGCFDSYLREMDIKMVSGGWGFSREWGYIGIIRTGLDCDGEGSRGCATSLICYISK